MYDGDWCWRQIGAGRNWFSMLGDSVGAGPVPGWGQTREKE